MSSSQLADAEGKAERRRASRFRCDLGIAIEWGAASLRGSVVDISIDGMFVELDQPLWIGARFAAQLEFEEPVRLECVVRRVQPLRGMAVTYAVPDEAGRAVIASYLERLRQP